MRQYLRLILALLRRTRTRTSPPAKPIVPTEWHVDVIACQVPGDTPNTCQVPIPGASVQLHGPDGYIGQITDAAGYTVFAVPTNFTDSDVIIDASGYLTAQAHIDVAATHDGARHNIVVLTPVPPARPTREQCLAVRADFAYTEVSNSSSPWQTYGYTGWSERKRANARALWKSIGMTHVAISWALNYPPSLTPAFDFRSHPDDFVVCLRELRADGFVIVLAASQEEVYGKYDGYNLAQNIADIESWPRWGWTEYTDVVWPGWESDDFIYTRDLLTILRTIRRVLPETVLAVQPGRGPTEGYIYSGNDGTVTNDARLDFWRAMHAPDINLNLFFLEPATPIFEGLQWREQLYAALMGASARIYARIDPVPAVFPFPPFARTDAYHEMWTRAAPIDGGGTPLVYWEGPGYLHWSSARKSEASAIARLVPGVIGTGDGI